MTYGDNFLAIIEAIEASEQRVNFGVKASIQGGGASQPFILIDVDDIHYAFGYDDNGWFCSILDSNFEDSGMFCDIDIAADADPKQIAFALVTVAKFRDKWLRVNKPN